MDSIARKAFVIAIAAALPPIFLVFFFTPSGGARVAAVVFGALLILVSWLLARSLATRITRLTHFAERLLDMQAERPQLPATDDEIGDLTRCLSRMAPQIEELVNRLRNELTRREAILASMTDGVLAVDARLNVTFSNNALMNVLGHPGEAEGVPLIKIVRDPALFQIVKQVVETGTETRKRLQLSGPGMRSFDVYVVPLSGTSSRGAIAIFRDISPGERLDRMRRDFIANVSHEFRTPLATIRGYAETLLDGGLEDEENRRKFVEIICANGVRLSNIAADLLTLSEIEGGRSEAEGGPISVGEVIRNAIGAIEPAASLAGVRVQLDEIPECYVFGHRTRFEQSIVNLIDNAVKFNRPNGEVRIQVAAESDGSIEIAISDTGSGIPQGDLTRVFERFYRVDKARSRQVGGTGLGLSIVKHAIEQMNGTVSVESELGKGSKFTITLPRHYFPVATA